MASGISPKLPLYVDENDGCFGLNKTYKDMVKQNFKMLVLTCPGERIWDMDYGIGLRNYLFMENTPSLANDLTSKIYQQVESYMPYVEIEDLKVTFDDIVQLLSVKISYKIIPLGENDIIVFDEKLQ